MANMPTIIEGKASSAAWADIVKGTRPWGGRGRHRRPRPRRVLLAAGGFMLVAGVLSLVRLLPDSGVGRLGTAEAEPRPDSGAGSGPGTGTGTGTGPGPGSGSGSGEDAGAGWSAKASASVSADPSASPTAASLMGGVSASAMPVPLRSPGATGTPTSVTVLPRGVTVPSERDDDDDGGDGRDTPDIPPTAAPTAPAATPSTASPAPTADRPGVCVPFIGLCVDGFGAGRPLRTVQGR